nr:EcsC family protein [Rhabdothermincola salaria]
MGTGGVAAAPGGLAVGGALAADVVATIALAARVVTHYAGYYGYDAREEEEKAVILAVIGVGVVGEGAAKQTAMLHVRQIAMMVARRAAWRELGEEVIVKLIQGLFAKLSVTLTKRKLAQALPVAGIAIGAGFNYALMRKVGTAASFAYRERFLIEKYGLDSGGPTPDLADVIDIEDFEDMPAIEDHTDESDMN